MPALPPVSNVLQVVLKGASSAADQDIINRFFIQYTGTAPTDLQLDTFSAAVGTAWNTDLAPFFKSTYALVEVETTDLSSSTAARGASNPLVTGSRAGGELSAGAAVVIQLHVARRYRGGHPRLYLMAFTQTDLATTSSWLTASVNALESAYASFIAAVVSAPWTGATLTEQVNVSYFEGFTNHTYPSGRVRAIPTLRGTPVVDTITLATVNPRPASQRRRNQQGQ